jgi:hypothetical protein
VTFERSQFALCREIPHSDALKVRAHEGRGRGSRQVEELVCRLILHNPLNPRLLRRLPARFRDTPRDARLAQQILRNEHVQYGDFPIDVAGIGGAGRFPRTWRRM